MCLKNSPVAVKRAMSRVRSKSYMTCYKVLSFTTYTGDLESPYWYKVYKPGVVRATSNEKKINTRRRYVVDDIGPAIHVFTNSKSAKERASCIFRAYVVPVRCELRNLMGMDGKGEAAFTSVTLSKKAHDRALAQAKKDYNAGLNSSYRY